ncbi:MAG: amino acid racemase [Jatrophihabitantaceae bacterium]
MMRIGIVGGVGPLAAANFYRRVIELSPASRDEDHLPVVLVSEQVPSRVEHLLGRGPSPVQALQRAVRMLTAAGVGAIAVPSATTHAYLPDMQAVTEVEIFDLLGETAREIEQGDFDRVMILATRATVHLRLFETRLRHCVPEYPDIEGQNVVDQLIEQVKRGAPEPPLRERLQRVVSSWSGSDVAVVLGCTELGVIASEPPAGVTVIDASEVLARRVVRSALTLTGTR